MVMLGGGFGYLGASTLSLDMDVVAVMEEAKGKKVANGGRCWSRVDSKVF